MAAVTGKQLISSGSSSDNESDHAKDEGSGSTIRRSFECTYCKRGFTNAQALGGHMNIHRKDRAKAKKAIVPTKNTNSYPDDPASYLMSYRQIAPNMSTSTTDSSRFGNWEAQRPAMMSGSFHMYRPSTMSEALINLPSTGGNYYYHPEPVRPAIHEMGPNLSLRVGTGTSNIACNNNIDNDNHEEEEEDNNEDVDLELRLGPR